MILEHLEICILNIYVGELKRKVQDILTNYKALAFPLFTWFDEDGWFNPIKEI